MAEPPKSSAGEELPASAVRLLSEIQSALAARLLKALAGVRSVEAALLQYREAVQAHVVMEYAKQHGLPQPGVPELVARARALEAAVGALPELQVPKQQAPRDVQVPPSVEPTPTPTAPHALSALEQACQAAPLVLVGGVAHLERLDFAPSALLQNLEWIDTTRHGTHAIGNLAQRLRAGRVSALVLVEGVLGHRHSEPLVQAARDGQRPVAFAGKGGRSALLRAFLAINERLLGAG
jgi:hypothetical protein